MSINDFLNKIKDKMGIDKMDILYLCIIILVGVSSFYLGRISNSSIFNNKSNNSIDIIQKGDLTNNINTDILGEEKAVKERVFVASKNGKMYYSLGCSGANRIKNENKIWFSTKEEAEKSGYTLALSCK